jgi:hypothetical protein
MSSELGETFKAFKEFKREKKLSNVENSLKFLTSLEIKHTILNAAIPHVLVCENIDYWPSTGKWRERGTGRLGRGVRCLVSHVRAKNKEANEGRVD